jgi:hypothetical protein
MNELLRQDGGLISDLIPNVEMVVLYDTYPGGQGWIDYDLCVKVATPK